jgi:hypothetical protein
MDIVCKCGYEGDEMVEYETEAPCKQVIDFTRGYRRVIKTLIMGNKTLNWACPKCGKVLVQQRGGLSYDMHEIKGMNRRLSHNSYAVKRLHKCETCGKRIDTKDEWISSGATGRVDGITKYYHEDCIKSEVEVKKNA